MRVCMQISNLLLISTHTVICLNNQVNKTNARQCNCSTAKNFQLNGKCCKNSIVYKNSLKTDKTNKFYYGICETTFKLRYNNQINCLKTINKLTLLNSQEPLEN